ncbi:MAG: OmpA family protein [Phycisphaerae bacterium]|nr:OmpA family protein [Phycisphaerae bacterium]
MFGCMKGATLVSGILLMFVATGCCCGLFNKPAVEEPGPVVEAPTYVEPSPAPAPPPPAPVALPAAPPPALPPAVTKSIQELSDKYPGLFKFDKDKGLLRFNADAMFDSGSFVVKPEAEAALGKLAKILNEEGARDRSLTIIGHTDTDPVVKSPTIRALKKLGKSVDNNGLSEARAEAVAAILRAGAVDASRMVTKGRGEAEPVGNNRTVEGKARNRRVEVYVTPAKSVS